MADKIFIWKVPELTKEVESDEFGCYDFNCKVRLTERTDSSCNFPFDLHVVYDGKIPANYTFNISVVDPVTKRMCCFEKSLYVPNGKLLECRSRILNVYDGMNLKNKHRGLWTIQIRILPRVRGDRFEDFDLRGLFMSRNLMEVDITRYHSLNSTPTRILACKSSSPVEDKNQKNIMREVNKQTKVASSVSNEEKTFDDKSSCVSNEEDNLTELTITSAIEKVNMQTEVASCVPDEEKTFDDKSSCLSNEKDNQNELTNASSVEEVSKQTEVACSQPGGEKTHDDESSSLSNEESTQAVISQEAPDENSESITNVLENENLTAAATPAEMPYNWEDFGSFVALELMQLESSANRIRTKREILKSLIAASEREDE